MTTSSPQKAPCATCGKVTGLFTCRGCQQDFCTRHVTEHRQELGKQMDELTLEHDRFRQTLIEQSTDVRQHPLAIEVDEWEQRCIGKIRQLADDARKHVEVTIAATRSKLTATLDKIAGELNRAREEDDYFEPDLKQWLQEMDQLKQELTRPANVKVHRADDDILSLVLKPFEIVAPKEVFHSATPGARIEDHGQIVVKDAHTCHVTIRGMAEYSSGQHRIRLQLEQYSVHKWILIGVVSNSVAIQATSYATASFYGWGGRNQVYFDGRNHQGFHGYINDLETNDIAELLIDCDDQTVRLTNERTRSTYKIIVPTKRCPFPWQLNVGLYHPHDRVRLLET